MDEMKWFVYIHTNLSNSKVYIGITHDISKRWRGNGIAYKSNHHFWQAIQKYGWEGFKHEVVYEDISHSEACAREIEMIAKYNACDRKYGYNKSPGGDSPLVIHRGEDHPFWGKHHSEETRKKLSESHKGEKHYWYGKHLPEETRKKIGDANRGRTLSKEQKDRLREAQLGRKASEQTKRKMSESQKKWERDSDVGEKISRGKNKYKKEIIQMSLSEEIIQIWPSVTMAAKEYNLATTQISKCCKGVLKSSGGFVWRYAAEMNLSNDFSVPEDYRQELIEKGVRIGKSKQRKAVLQLALDGKLIKIWPSITDAAKSNDMVVSAISRCCSGVVKTSGGYVWKYATDGELATLK